MLVFPGVEQAIFVSYLRVFNFCVYLGVTIYVDPSDHLGAVHIIMNSLPCRPMHRPWTSWFQSYHMWPLSQLYHVAAQQRPASGMYCPIFFFIIVQYTYIYIYILGCSSNTFSLGVTWALTLGLFSLNFILNIGLLGPQHWVCLALTLALTLGYLGLNIGFV